MSSNERSITGTWDYASLPSNIVVGEDCWLERQASFSRFHSKRQPGLVLGDRVRLYTWSGFSVEPEGFIEVGSDSVLVGAIFMCAESITLGRNVVVSYHVTISDADFHPIDLELRRQDAIAVSPHGNPVVRPPFQTSPVVIEDDVWIGIGAIILKGVHIGRGARIGAGSVVTRHVPAGACVAGNPARLVPPEELPS